MYNVHGFRYTWSEIKDAKLRQERGLSFLDVMSALERDDIIYFGAHYDSKRQNQILLVVLISEYPHVVPAIPNDDGFFLKTIFPSRRFKDGEKN